MTDLIARCARHHLEHAMDRLDLDGGMRELLDPVNGPDDDIPAREGADADQITLRSAAYLIAVERVVRARELRGV